MADIITAAEARSRADQIQLVGRTPEQLKDRYNQGLKEIARAADTGYYGVPLLVGALDKDEFLTLMTTQGFRVFQNSTTPEGQRTVNQDPQGDLESIEVNWSTFEFTQTTTSLQRPDGVTVFVKVTGYPLARNLYYTLTGELTATDYTNNSDEGEIQFDSQGEGGIFVNVKTGGSRVGKTIQILVYYDSNRETLLHSYDAITVIV